MITLISHSVEDTQRYAEQVSSHLKAGDILLLQGDLAAGKTKFVECCCQVLGYKDPVNSPTYTMANVYPLNDYDIVHADFYRMKSEGEIFEMGLDFYLDEALIFIEWGERFADFFSDYLHLQIEPVDGEETARKLTFSATGPLWKKRFEELRKTLENTAL